MAAGTITLTNNSDAVTGVGTAFLTDLAAGDFIVANVGGIAYTLPVQAVASATALTIISKFTGPTLGGLAWFVVKRDQQAMITAALVAQSTEAIRGLNYDKSNWQAVFSATGDITVTMPDGMQFTGPSWQKIVTLLAASDIELIQPLADQIRADAQQVAEDKTVATGAAIAAGDSATTAVQAKADAAASQTAAAASEVSAKADADRAEAAAGTIDTTAFLRKDGNLSGLADKDAARTELGVYSQQEVDDAIAAGGGASALLKANNLSDLPNKSTSRANLELGTAAVANVGGVVSMDGNGLPNGAIFEHGNNANGKYTKFADGTMICWFTGTTSVSVNIASGSLYRSGTQTLTFPAAFISAPTVTPSVKRTGAAEIAWGVFADPTTTTVSILGYSGASTTVNVGYTATGRWV